MPVAAAAMASVILAVALNIRPVTRPASTLPPTTVAPTAPVAAVDLLSDPQSPGDDDTALTLVAELSSDMDLDGAREAGLAGGGSAEHAVTHLDGGELRELRRLLQEELARSGD
jgi:hypothetical protein